MKTFVLPYDILKGLKIPNIGCMNVKLHAKIQYNLSRLNHTISGDVAVHHF